MPTCPLTLPNVVEIYKPCSNPLLLTWNSVNWGKFEIAMEKPCGCEQNLNEWKIINEKKQDKD